MVRARSSALRNTLSLKECLEEAYVKGPSVVDGEIPDDPDIPMMLNKVYPVQEVVKIDCFLPGCPTPADAYWQALQAILAGKPGELPYELIKKD